MNALQKKLQEQVALAEEYGFTEVFVRIAVQDAKDLLPVIAEIKLVGVIQATTLPGYLK